LLKTKCCGQCAPPELIDRIKSSIIEKASWWQAKQLFSAHHPAPEKQLL
jgi:hypothetical protein